MANPATLNALNAATDVVAVDDGNFSIGLYSNASFVGTVELQRRRVGGATWRTIASYSGPVEETGEMPGNWQARLVVTAYTSGSIVGEIST